MNNYQIIELHYITPIRNLLSIFRNGIFCHNRAKQLPHADISMNEIQDRREQIKVPNGLHLHDYVNLYFDAHNPMLSRRRNQNLEICILRISADVLNLQGVVLSDRNASSSYAKFLTYPEGLVELNFEKIFSRYWTDPDQFVEWENKSFKCAEVLVPNVVLPEYITGVYVFNRTAQHRVTELNLNLNIIIQPEIFF